MREDGCQVGAVVALGSNLGNRWDHLAIGIRRLREGAIPLLEISPVFETPPLGLSDQPPFLNLVVMGDTPLGPEELLRLLQDLEAESGRVRTVRNGPRTLDMDLLFFEDRVIRRDNLRVPHPRWRRRSFVVRPLLCLAPDLRDPETGFTVAEIARLWEQEPREIREVARGDDFPWVEQRENEGR
jgi:2-amino-4-hydroxy-6-hydroxymethyldihydropteridine diphosphokinase